MINPWPVEFYSTKVACRSTTEKIQAMMVINKAMAGWPEFFATRNKSSYHISLLFDSKWPCRYPHPNRVVFDNGTEFTGGEFQELLNSYGIKAVSTTVRNPKSNRVIKRVHLNMGDMLRAMSFSNKDWLFELQRALDAVAWAVRTAINLVIKYSPSHLPFNQDMIFH
jgi:hypothetical protein